MLGWLPSSKSSSGLKNFDVTHHIFYFSGEKIHIALQFLTFPHVTFSVQFHAFYLLDILWILTVLLLHIYSSPSLRPHELVGMAQRQHQWERSKDREGKELVPQNWCCVVVGLFLLLRWPWLLVLLKLSRTELSFFLTASLKSEIWFLVFILWPLALLSFEMELIKELSCIWMLMKHSVEVRVFLPIPIGMKLFFYPPKL